MDSIAFLQPVYWKFATNIFIQRIYDIQTTVGFLKKQDQTTFYGKIAIIGSFSLCLKLMAIYTIMMYYIINTAWLDNILVYKSLFHNFFLRNSCNSSVLEFVTSISWIHFDFIRFPILKQFWSFQLRHIDNYLISSKSNVMLVR